MSEGAPLLSKCCRKPGDIETLVDREVMLSFTPRQLSPSNLKSEAGRSIGTLRSL